MTNQKQPVLIRGSTKLARVAMTLEMTLWMNSLSLSKVLIPNWRMAMSLLSRWTVNELQKQKETKQWKLKMFGIVGFYVFYEEEWGLHLQNWPHVDDSRISSIQTILQPRNPGKNCLILPLHCLHHHHLVLFKTPFDGLRYRGHEIGNPRSSWYLKYQLSVPQW